MVVAKSEHAYTVLKRAFKERTVDKTYHALVQGHPDPLKGTVDAPIDRHPLAGPYAHEIADADFLQRHVRFGTGPHDSSGASL